MKKNLFFVSFALFVFITLTSSAQIINPGFETWTTNIIVPTAMDPNSGNGTTGWWDYNFFNSSLVGSSPVSVLRCTDTVHSGTYSVRLETKVYTPTSWNIYKTWGIPFIGHLYDDTLGILFNGNVNVPTQTYRPGIPCTQSLSQFKFFYQYRPNGNDTAECRVELVHAGTVVAGGSFKTNVPTGNTGWQQAVVNFTYVSALTPDTLYILFSASSLDVSPKANSVLWIDDASVTLPSGVETFLPSENNIKLFPNPSNGLFTIEQGEATNKDETIEIFNSMGQLIYTKDLNNPISTIDISSEASGIYLYRVKENDQVISSGEIILN